MTKFTADNLNRFLLVKLPSAYLSGIRVHSISSTEATAKVRHRWINQNPFRSLYWATQGMAAELVAGLLLMNKIRNSGHRVSMLVVSQQGDFHKKATGRITFVCSQGAVIDRYLDRAIETGEGVTFTLDAEGFDEDQVCVSSFRFTWSIKLKK